jgi:DNA repair exonuclease SbcCD nuclease subunit
MKIRFVSDTHLGLSRQSHTTPESAKRMQGCLHDVAMEATEPQEETIVIHAGDLFDKYSNNEAVIAQAAELTPFCDYILAGNHDCSNRTDTVSSFELLSTMQDKGNDAIFVKGQRLYTYTGNPDFRLCLVPHQMSQADFVLQLNEAVEKFKYMQNTGVLKILVTHCNYDNPLTEKSESSLNLTREAAEELLKTFDFILLGHEHNPRTDFDGRLVVLGSLMPTSFSDISDKCVWELDTETRALSKRTVWGRHDGSASGRWIDIGPDMFEGFDGLQFLDITGVATPSQMPEVSKLIQDCWDNGPNLLMVRNSVVVEGEEAVSISDAHKHVNVVDRIKEELKGTAMGVKFEGYVNG